MKMIICARFARTFLGKRQCVLEKRDIIIFSFYSVHVPLVKNGRPNDGFCHHRATINFILVSILMCHLRFIAYTQKKSRDFTANISSTMHSGGKSAKKSHFQNKSFVLKIIDDYPKQNVSSIWSNVKNETFLIFLNTVSLCLTFIN